MPPELLLDVHLDAPQASDSLPIASECEHLVVGQTYLVPCVSGLAVIGEPHTDNDHFNSTPEHWHVDSRFEELACSGMPQTCAVPTGAQWFPKDSPKLDTLLQQIEATEGVRGPMPLDERLAMARKILKGE